MNRDDRFRSDKMSGCKLLVCALMLGSVSLVPLARATDCGGPCPACKTCDANSGTCKTCSELGGCCDNEVCVNFSCNDNDACTTDSCVSGNCNHADIDCTPIPIECYSAWGCNTVTGCWATSVACRRYTEASPIMNGCPPLTCDPANNTCEDMLNHWSITYTTGCCGGCADCFGCGEDFANFIPPPNPLANEGVTYQHVRQIQEGRCYCTIGLPFGECKRDASQSTIQYVDKPVCKCLPSCT